jgi:sarcosine oxidase
MEAGILFPEACITAFLGAAADNGATIHVNEPVLRFTATPYGVEVTTSLGTYGAEKLIVSAGAWLGELIPECRLPLTVRRQVLFWFDNANPSWRDYFQPRNMPIFIWEYLRDNIFYGFADLGSGTKIAWHHGGRVLMPDQLSNDITDEEISAIKTLAAARLAIDPVFRDASVCMYTNTPDGDFIIDYHPDHPNIIIASPCSGHGFKFSSLTGKLLADLALRGHTEFDLSPFAIGRSALTGRS